MLCEVSAPSEVAHSHGGGSPTLVAAESPGELGDSAKNWLPRMGFSGFISSPGDSEIRQSLC